MKNKNHELKICVLGTRGFPNVQGGVEAHCEKLCPRLVKLGCKLTVFTRPPYVDPQKTSYEGVNLRSIVCPRTKLFEAIVHTVKGAFYAKKLNADIVHIHATGPSLVVPIARFLRMKVVMTNHGPDYERKKWSRFAKLIIWLGEFLGSTFANEIICIAENIAANVKRKYNRNCHVIPNGVEVYEAIKSKEALAEYDLQEGKYILAVGRFVPEKGLDVLIEAFNQSAMNGYKLVIAGEADHKDAYSKQLKKMAQANHSIILTGFITGRPLQELYSHAGLFVLPSYYEGLPIALLEAMSYGLLCIASDIPANRCVDLPEENYFTPGDADKLAEKLREFAGKLLSEEQRVKQINMVQEKYNWDKIAEQTLEVYKKVVFR